MKLRLVSTKRNIYKYRLYTRKAFHIFGYSWEMWLYRGRIYGRDSAAAILEAEARVNPRAPSTFEWEH